MHKMPTLGELLTDAKGRRSSHFKHRHGLSQHPRVIPRIPGYIILLVDGIGTLWLEIESANPTVLVFLFYFFLSFLFPFFLFFGGVSIVKLLSKHCHASRSNGMRCIRCLWYSSESRDSDTIPFPFCKAINEHRRSLPFDDSMALPHDTEPWGWWWGLVRVSRG